jgi:prepilin-type N-terminal cleavage/methylation domain-containing protein
MKQWARKQTGFTIVELLIVIVVIAILAVIIIVAYTGIRERAIVSSVQSGLSQATKKVLAYAVDNADTYPITLADAGVLNTNSVTYQYSSDNTTTPRQYAITASNGITGTTVYYVSNTQTTAAAGIAPGHNLVPWDEPQATSTPLSPWSGVTIDTTEYRGGNASLRIAPDSTARPFRISPITAASGQVVTVSLWIKTDSNWNGTSNNSKIRFGAVGGGLINACSYQGVKTTWTFVTCSQPVSSNISMNLSVGNDGTVGNIWLDDISVSVR